MASSPSPPLASCPRAGDQVFHAVRVRVFPYPENAAVVWVMFAVRYLSIL